MTLKDAIKAIEDGLHTSLAIDGACQQRAKEALEWLKEQPEIIRCKDCKHWSDDASDDPQMWCRFNEECWFASDFCSYAERRE